MRSSEPPGCEVRSMQPNQNIQMIFFSIQSFFFPQEATISNLLLIVFEPSACHTMCHTTHTIWERQGMCRYTCVCVSLWSETLPAVLHKPVMKTEAFCRQLYHSTCSNKILLKWHHHRWCEEGEQAWTKVLHVLTSHHLGCSAHTAPKSRRHFHDHIGGSNYP